MNTKLTNKLIKKFPKFFRQTKLSPQESCMSFGIECGEGWYGILEEFCEMLEDCGERCTFYDYVDTWYNKLFRWVFRKLKLPLYIREKFPWFQVKSIEPEAKDRIFEFSQIKEKFGLLTIYYDTNSKTYDDIANIMTKWAEWKSEKTCEECGKPGKMAKGNWLRVRCKICDKQWNL